ncbi:MAG: 3-dehydroquinate synthase [Atopobiaceae bacterium]|jgi:3-dehydroquinate synthetase
MSATGANAEKSAVQKCWVSTPGSSCGIRWGEGAIDLAGKISRDVVGRPKRALVVIGPNADADLVEYVTKLLVGEEFLLHTFTLDHAGEKICSLASATELFETFAAHDLTQDDLCLVIGDVKLISLASYACSQWCNTLPLVVVPTDEVALLRGATTPLGITVASKPQMINVHACAKNALMEPEICIHELDSESSREARVLMVSTAVAQSEKEFSALWDEAEHLMNGDSLLMLERLCETTKGRGHLVSSTSIAIRESVRYGEDIAEALMRLVPPATPFSTVLAESLRFSARLSVGLGKLSVDDMLAQDELLEMLEIPTLHAALDAKEVVRAIRETRFLRTNRFMVLIPETLGRVRLANVDDDLLLEHVGAWCDAMASEEEI